MRTNTTAEIETSRETDPQSGRPAAEPDRKCQPLELNETVGDQALCAWRVAPGWVWIQTRLTEVTKVLSRRSGFRVVAYGVGGGYLRTFESQMTLAQVESLLLQLRTDCLQKTIEKRGLAARISVERSFCESRGMMEGSAAA